MTAKEKEEIKSRLERAEYFERVLAIVTDALTTIHHPDMAKEITSKAAADNVWQAISIMPKDYRDAIAEIVNKWGGQVNEEYKKL